MQESVHNHTSFLGAQQLLIDHAEQILIAKESEYENCLKLPVLRVQNFKLRYSIQ